MFGRSWGIEWGAGAAGVDSGLTVVAADAVRENMIAVEFSLPVYWSNLRDPYDAAERARYSVEVVGGVDLEGLPPHPVLVSRVEQLSPTSIGLWLDRALSSYGTRYRVVAQGLRSTAGVHLVGTSSAVFAGSRRGPLRADSSSGIDVGNADLAFALAPDGVAGGYVVDTSGDYASESGLAAVRKRCVRRLTTPRGAFAHLPTYGVDIAGAVKRLGTVDAANAIAADAEAQLRQEPEVVSASVSVDTSRIAAGLVVFKVRVVTNLGSLSFATSAGGVAID